MSAPEGNAHASVQSSLRALPAVEIILGAGGLDAEIKRYSRPLVTQAVRDAIADMRRGILAGEPSPENAHVITRIKSRLAAEWPAFSSTVINATGVILHTNLGRAPLPLEAIAALSQRAGEYIGLESDLAGGGRGVRILELRRLLCVLTGAEDGLVVNNNAAAMLLVLVALAHGREAVVSRGELVQIGGGFRVPEILEQSGVILREVGTTNQTYAADYAAAVNRHSGMLLKIHPSNFEQRGFVHEATLAELATIARQQNIPLVYDLGSGAMLETADFGLEHEPTVQEALATGADIVCFSGDKLVGGPQAGIILGKQKHIQKLLSHPLLRVVRLDKLSAIALEAVVKLYLDGNAADHLPVWKMMALDVASVSRRARRVVSALHQRGIQAGIRDGLSMVGGGTLPEKSIPTKLVAIKTSLGADEFARRLRTGDRPLVGRIERDELMLDLRTVNSADDRLLAGIIANALGERG